MGDIPVRSLSLGTFPLDFQWEVDLTISWFMDCSSKNKFGTVLRHSRDPQIHEEL